MQSLLRDQTSFFSFLCQFSTCNKHQRSEMENSKVSCSWWCSSSKNPDHHLPLLSTLSELGKNVSAMLKLMQQEDGETFVGQTETNYQKNTEFQRRVEEFYRSCCSLADYWGENAGTKMETLHESKIGHQLEDCLIDSSSLEDDQSTVTEAEEKTKSRNNDPEPTFDMAGSLDQRISCSEQMSKFAEDVIGELVRRYNEKREANRVLQCQVERLMEEGRVLRMQYDRLVGENGAPHLKLNSPMEDGKSLQSCPRCSSIIRKQRRPHFSRFKCLFF